jgi:trehalose 6-phosphate synthase/phosphatase
MVYMGIQDFVKPSDFKDKKLSGRILNAFTNIPFQIYKDSADSEWVSYCNVFSSSRILTTPTATGKPSWKFSAAVCF